MITHRAPVFRGPAGLVRGGLILLSTLQLAACCSPACREDRLPGGGRRSTPLETAVLFQYAIQQGCWRTAYDCLDEASRSQVSYLRFRWGFCRLVHPELDMEVCEIVRRASFYERTLRYSPQGERAWMRSLSEMPGGMVRVDLAFVLQSGTWQLDLGETLRKNTPEG